MTFQRLLGLLKGYFGMNELALCEGRDDGKLVSSLGSEVAHMTLDSCACCENSLEMQQLEIFCLRKNNELFTL